MFVTSKPPPSKCMQLMPQTVIKFACANIPAAWYAADTSR